MIVDNGETLINCLAYIDLNAIRAGIVKKPENYRRCSLGYHVQARNKGRLLSLDFGLREFGVKTASERLRYYRKYLYEKGSINRRAKQKKRRFDLGGIDRFRYRTRYFTDSGIIGTKAFVMRLYRQFETLFSSKHEKKPRAVTGLDGVFSLKRLSERI